MSVKFVRPVWPNFGSQKSMASVESAAVPEGCSPSIFQPFYCAAGRLLFHFSWNSFFGQVTHWHKWFEKKSLQSNVTMSISLHQLLITSVLDLLNFATIGLFFYQKVLNVCFCLMYRITLTLKFLLVGPFDLWEFFLISFAFQSA